MPTTMVAPPSVLPAAQPPAQVVLPAALPGAAAPADAIAAQQPAPVIRDVAPGENPFGPSVATTARRPAAQPTATGPAAQPAGIAPPADSIETQIAKLSQKAEEPAVASKPEVDETALRYYAQTRDLKRLGAELRRLKTLYPDWDAPKTSSMPRPTFPNSRFGTSSAAATMCACAPKSPSCRAKIRTGSRARTARQAERTMARQALEMACRKRGAQVVSLAEATPQLMVCAEMNTMWITWRGRAVR